MGHILQRGIILSCSCAALLYGAEAELGTIDISADIDTEVIKDIHGEDVKSADLAEALFKQSPSISMVRRSGIANDIILRGQKKDNINVTIDGAKIYGACPNRMDPPVSHILTNNIDYIEVNEGPYNVEDFGVLSGDVKIHTLKPEKAFHGDLNLGLGSWGYQKAALSLTGGTDRVRFLISGSAEKSEQYEDGDGNDFSGQQALYIKSNPQAKGMAYLPEKRDMDAYEKKTFMAKLFWNITDDQELRVGYTANRSDDVLYPNTPMDANYDDSDIYTIEYSVKRLGEYSKKLSLNLYQSEVDHPMSNRNRVSVKKAGEITHHLQTKMQGAKLKNELDINNHALTAGVDYSLRNWDGTYYKNGTPFPAPKFHSIWDVDTENYAFFIKDKIDFGKLDVDVGLRYNDTTVSTGRAGVPDNHYNGLDGNLFATYTRSESVKLFAGFGIASRVPDGKELYYYNKVGKEIGNPDLDKVVNSEFDVGFDMNLEDVTLKGKVFYSFLKDFIFYNATENSFENGDSTIYGFELSGTYIATDSLYFDGGMSYQRGQKDHPLIGQSGTNMPEIPPFKFNAAANYDWDDTLHFRAELVASGSWSDYDEENGEQKLDGYGIVNLRGTKQIGDFEIIVGIDNLFDSAYAVSNTYKDLTLITGGGDVMLMNEPGRYVYTNLKYKF